MSYIAKFNPYSMADETILSVATGRKELLSKVLAELNNNLTSDSVSQHLLIRGPRGMGKSFFLKYLQINFNREDKFQNCEFLLLPEEQNNLNSPSDLIKLILGELTGHSGEMTTLWEEPADVWESELKKLKDYLAEKKAANNDYLLVVVVENLDEFLRNIQTDKKTRKVYESRFRHLLEKIKQLSIIGATPRIDPEAIDGDYNSRLFHAFKKCNLRRWNEEDYFRYFDRRQAIKEAETGKQFSIEHTSLMRAKLKALSHYTGGSPRMAVVLTNLLLEDDVISTVKTLFGLIDDLTPYYQDLTKSIPKKSKMLFDTLIRKGENLSQSELAGIVGATQSKISKAFLWLKDNGYIIGRKRSNSAAFSYWVSDRIHVLYYQLREIHHNKNITPIWLLSDFLVAIYQERDLRNYADKYLREQPSHEANDMAKVYLLAAGIFEKEELLDLESEDWLEMVEEVPEENERINEILKEIEELSKKENEDVFFKELKYRVIELISLLEKVKNDKILYKYITRLREQNNIILYDKKFVKSSNFLLETLVPLLSDIPNQLQIALVYQQLGIGYSVIAKNRKGLYYLDKADEFYEKLKLTDLQDLIKLNKILLYLFNEQITQAEIQYKLIKDRLENIDEKFKYQIHNEFAETYYKMRKFNKSIKFSKIALEISAKDRNEVKRTDNLNRIGLNLIGLSKLDKALSYFQKALKIQKKEGNENGIETSVIFISHVYSLQEKINKAINLLNLYKIDLEVGFKSIGFTISYSENNDGVASAFKIGKYFFNSFKQINEDINLNNMLSNFFSSILSQKISPSLFQDLAQEALLLFPEPESQVIINAALHTINYVESGKDEAYLEKLDPDMAIALKAIVEAGKL